MTTKIRMGSCSGCGRALPMGSRHVVGDQVCGSAVAAKALDRGPVKAAGGRAGAAGRSIRPAGGFHAAGPIASSITIDAEAREVAAVLEQGDRRGDRMSRQEAVALVRLRAIEQRLKNAVLVRDLAVAGHRAALGVVFGESEDPGPARAVAEREDVSMAFSDGRMIERGGAAVIGLAARKAAAVIGSPSPIEIQAWEMQAAENLVRTAQSVRARNEAHAIISWLRALFAQGVAALKG